MRSPSIALVMALVPLVGCPEPSGDDDAGGSSSSSGTDESSGSEGTDAESGSADDSTGTASCPNPLTDEELEWAAFSPFGDAFDMQPGTSRTLTIGLYGGGGSFDPITDCVRYSVSPTDGATIDPDTGTLAIANEVAPGTTYTVEADIESGRRVVEATVTVYTSASHPLVGQWKEVARLECETDGEIVPDDPMEELIFTTAGFRATWFPFEAYVDYWGSYEADAATGSLTLQVEGGNDVPASLDPQGLFERVDDELVLREMWLGRSGEADTEPPDCGHVFVRVGG